MGASRSKNEIDNTLKQSIESLNEIVQDCSSGITAEQGVKIVAKGNVNLQDINLDQMVTFSSSCLQSNDTESKIDAQLLQSMQQAAESAVKGWGIGYSEASNLTRNYTDLRYSISNAFKQDCRSAIMASNLIDVESSDGSVSVSGYNAKQTLDANRDCIQNSKAVSAVAAKVQQTLDQKATATVAGLDLGSFIALIVGLVAIALIMVFGKSGGGGGGSSIIWFVLIGLIVLGVGGYIIYNKMSSSDDSNPDDPCEQKLKALLPCTTQEDCKDGVCSFGSCVAKDCSSDCKFAGCSFAGSVPTCNAEKGIFECSPPAAPSPGTAGASRGGSSPWSQVLRHSQ